MDIKQQVVYALLGIAADLFTEDEAGRITLGRGVQAHIGERATVDDLVFHGYLYKWLDSFSNTYLETALRNAKFSPYVGALCRGLEEYLETYRQDIAALEGEVLERDPPLEWFRVRLASHFSILPHLHSLGEAVVNRSLVSAALLDELRWRAVSTAGLPVVHSVVLRLLRYANDLFLQHLSFWIVYSRLPDGDDFFVRRINSPQPQSQLPLTAGTVVVSVGGKASHPYVATDLDEEGPAAIEDFEVHLQAVPKYLKDDSMASQLPEKILFIGKAVRILAIAKDKFRASTAYARNPISPRMAAMETECSTPTKRRTVEENAVVAECLITDEERQEMLRELTYLTEAKAELSVHQLVTTVERIHRQVGRHLWALLTGLTRMNDHLRAVRDYFLCCRGDFYAHFIERSSQTLTHFVRDEARKELAEHWRTAQLHSTADDDPFFERVTLKWDTGVDGSLADEGDAAEEKPRTAGGPGGADVLISKQTVARKRIFNAWRGLSLEYAMEWPLELLLRPNTMQMYNRLFQFLTLVLRVQKALHLLWKKLTSLSTTLAKSTKTQRSEKCRANLGAFIFLRQRMGHFMDNIAYYIQVDVLETQSTLLQKRLDLAQDFDSVCKAHEKFLQTLFSSCFLDKSSTAICLALEDIFQHCIHLIILADTKLGALHAYGAIFPKFAVPNVRGVGKLDLGSVADHVLQIDTRELAALSREFDRRSQLLYSLLLGKRQHAHLAGLLLRLDYNSFGEKPKQQA
eukprot:TRINITY_DN4307_c0_g2_i1.p1 TRINITY_DN4307_c0_g2~~TRINITY_DN4307_c0_g2_i1.p1  ORF type:complete len:754 (+),score=126.32 TRINITY_DN4307_c0_g2_i1:28-2262(+)